MKTSYPFLENVVVEQNKLLTLNINGNWPTPSWELKEIKKEIDMNRKIITVHILGVSKGGIALQMLKPFSYDIEVELSNYSNWKIIVKGRVNDIIKMI